MRTIFIASAETIDVENPGILPNGGLNRKVQRHVGRRETKTGKMERKGRRKRKKDRESERRKRKGRVLTRGGRKGRNDWHLGNCLVKTGRSREASNSVSTILSVRARTRKSVTKKKKKICIR